MNNYKRGLITGIPIALGYLSVSFTFGIMAVSFGLSWWQAVLISITTVTSAGQFAGIGIMIHPGQYIQMLISQITINIRYSFMSISIGQKADSRFSGIYRWLLGFFITDEIFAVATKEDEIKRSYFAGLATLPYLGWALGTFIGAILGNILPIPFILLFIHRPFLLEHRPGPNRIRPGFSQWCHRRTFPPGRCAGGPAGWYRPPGQRRPRPRNAAGIPPADGRGYWCTAAAR